MNKTNIILAIVAASIGSAAILLHAQNKALDGEIRANAEQCTNQIALLKERYQAEIDDLRRHLLEQYNQDPDAVVEAEKPRFNQLVSSGHRMQAIGSKYEFLLESALLDADGKKQLRRFLYQWERLAASASMEKTKSGAIPPQLRAELDNTEAQIQALLTDPLDYQHFLTQRQRDL